jgi:hypothetical protein
MPGLTIKAKTSITKEQFIAALTNFGPERGALWANSQSSHLVVHALGDTTADVTEGSNILGGAWERLHYDWSNPAAIELRTVDSNIWAQGSGWQYVIEEAEDGTGSLITATVTRYPNSKKGYFILIIFGSIGRPLIKRGFRQTVQAVEKNIRSNKEA